MQFLRKGGALICSLILLFNSAAFASYGDNIYGDVIYGDSGGGAILESSLALELSATLADSNINNREGLLTLLAQSTDSHVATADFVRSLTLSAIASLAETNQLDAVSAMSLSSIASHSPVNTLDEQALLTLVAQVSQTHAIAGSEIDVSLTLSAIADILLAGGMSINSEVSLSAVATQAQIADSIREGILTLTAAGDYSTASQLVAAGSLLLQATTQMAETGNVDFITMLNLTGYVSQLQSVAGTVIDTELLLSAVSTILLGDTAVMTAELPLSLQAAIDAVSAMSKESALELTAQGNIQGSAQVIAYNTLLLQATADMITGSKIDWNVLLELSGQVMLTPSVAGTTYDSVLALSAASSMVESAGLDFTTELTLSATANITFLLASVIKEGVLALNASGDYATASQLSAQGSILLNMIASHTLEVNNSVYSVEVLLNAIATAVATGDTGELQELIQRRIFIKDNAARGFIKDTERRIFNVR